MREIKVENVIIGKQFKDSENYQEFLKIVDKNKIKVYVVEAGQRINIEKNLYFDVLWPDSNNVVTENVLNNNSLVSKLVYRSFSILFAGDIEEIAEKKILSAHDKNDILNSTVLKVAHHGSKTSSYEEFISNVKPKFALIGVGKNNKFGHPSNEVIESLKEKNIDIFRTDISGEIEIQVTIDSKIKIKTMN